MFVQENKHTNDIYGSMAQAKISLHGSNWKTYSSFASINKIIEIEKIRAISYERTVDVYAFKETFVGTLYRLSTYEWNFSTKNGLMCWRGKSVLSSILMEEKKIRHVLCQTQFFSCFRCLIFLIPPLDTLQGNKRYCVTVSNMFYLGSFKRFYCNLQQRDDMLLILYIAC